MTHPLVTALPHVLKSYEVLETGEIRPRILFNLFQDMADISAEKLGFGRTFCQEQHKLWVGSFYHAHLLEPLMWGDELVFETWPSGASLITATRDFRVLKNGKPVALATSQWVLLDAGTLRPIKLAPYLSEREVFSERALDLPFTTPQEVTEPDFTKTYDILYDYIDVNRHVNNAVYPALAAESVPDAFKEDHRLKEIAVAFKQSARLGNTITAKTKFVDNTSYHALTNTEGKDFARVQLVWENR